MGTRCSRFRESTSLSTSRTEYRGIHFVRVQATPYDNWVLAVCACGERYQPRGDRRGPAARGRPAAWLSPLSATAARRVWMTY